MLKPSNIEKWYVNEGDIGQAIPCEMSIEELETPIIHVEWYFQQEMGRNTSSIFEQLQLNALIEKL